MTHARHIVADICYHCQIDPDQTSVDSKDVRLYFYYAGLICIGLKKFTRATELLKTAISVPAIVPSAVMIEAYKKFVLVSLILSGQVRLIRVQFFCVRCALTLTCLADRSIAALHFVWLAASLPPRMCSV